MKKRRLLSIVLTITMVFTMFGNLTAFALMTTARQTEYFLIKAVDTEGIPVPNVTFSLEHSIYNNKIEGTANSSEYLSLSNYNRNDSCSLTITSCPGYKIPATTTFTSNGTEYEFSTSDWITENSTEGEEYHILTCTLHEAYTFSLKAVDQDNKIISGLKYKITYTDKETNSLIETEEVEADGTSFVQFITDEPTCKLTYTSKPYLVVMPEQKEITISLNGNTSQFEAVQMTAQINQYTHTYQLATSMKQVYSVFCTIKVVDSTGSTPDGVYAIYDGWRCDSTMFGLMTFEKEEAKIDLSFEGISEKYVDPGTVTVKYDDLEDISNRIPNMRLTGKRKDTTLENYEENSWIYDLKYTLVEKQDTSPFTVSAKVNSETNDVDEGEDGVQVNAKDIVKVDVVVSGGDFTNADWEMIYDPTLFEYVNTTNNADVEKKGTITTDNTKTAVLSGKLVANVGTTNDNEFTDGTAIVTYEFKALAQNADKVGTFKIESAHANNYVIAGTNDNKIANTANATVKIVLVDNTPGGGTDNTVTVPAGTFKAAEKKYNAQKQAGNAFELAEGFADAKVTYFANEDGSAVEDTTELANESFKTTLPSWKNVGEYTYYAKIYGDGLKTTYVATTLKITPATLIPSANFAVDPDVTEVKFVPTLEGVLDGSHNGTVTVKYTDKTGAEQTKTLNASDFVYDGETTSVYKGTEVFAVNVPTSGEFTVTLDYTEGVGDNYTGGENEVKVDVDKINAEQEIAQAIEDAITNEFVYDSEAHGVVIDNDKISAIKNGTWKQKSIGNVNDADDTEMTVTNVGEDKLIKIVYEDESSYYNDVVVYTVLKVTPANVKITVNNKSKVMNSNDPELTGTVKVVDEDGNEVMGVTFNENGLYGEDNLEVSYEREAGEEVGTYDITASYAPNDNYTVTVENGEFEITAPEIDPENPEDAIVKVEVVDLSKGETNGDATPDYTADKRLILVYTDVDKLFYGYKVDDNTTEKMFDVTAAGYKYVDNNYTDGTFTEDEHEYKHVYGIVVDAIETYTATDDYEQKYRDKVVFLSSDLKDAPVNIVYDGDINLSNEIDVNDYSMTNGIYNSKYERAAYIKNILKADINGDKKVDTGDVGKVKEIYEKKN